MMQLNGATAEEHFGQEKFFSNWGKQREQIIICADIKPFRCKTPTKLAQTTTQRNQMK